MLWSDIKHTDGTQAVYVDGNPVWDFKLEDMNLVLISEPVEGVESFEKITVMEIENEVGLFRDLTLISETDRTEITENRITICN